MTEVQGNIPQSDGEAVSSPFLEYLIYLCDDDGLIFLAQGFSKVERGSLGFTPCGLAIVQVANPATIPTIMFVDLTDI